MPGGKRLAGASPKSERMYEHIKSSEEARGVPAPTAKKIAAATTNAHRAKTGEAVTTHGKSNPKHK